MSLFFSWVSFFFLSSLFFSFFFFSLKRGVDDRSRGYRMPKGLKAGLCVGAQGRELGVCLLTFISSKASLNSSSVVRPGREQGQE